MKKILILSVLYVSTISCGVFGSLTSNTKISSKDKFVLGDNKHNSFKSFVKNDGTTILKVYHAPIDGGTHSPIFLDPKESTTIKVASNTALVIENTGDVETNVSLKVRGDLGLSMGYNNKK